jgi:hypothetical protein
MVGDDPLNPKVGSGEAIRSNYTRVNMLALFGSLASVYAVTNPYGMLNVSTSNILFYLGCASVLFAVMGSVSARTEIVKELKEDELKGANRSINNYRCLLAAISGLTMLVTPYLDHNRIINDMLSLGLSAGGGMVMAGIIPAFVYNNFFVDFFARQREKQAINNNAAIAFVAAGIGMLALPYFDYHNLLSSTACTGIVGMGAVITIASVGLAIYNNLGSSAELGG